MDGERKTARERERVCECGFITIPGPQEKARGVKKKLTEIYSKYQSLLQGL
jgi:hypothetical protein